MIWSVYGLENIHSQEFLVAKLKVKEEKGTFTLDDGNGNILYTQTIEYTDFPLDEISLFIEPLDEKRRVILLPSEH
jgi:hypothetical protein